MGSSILVFSFMVWGLFLEPNFCTTLLFVVLCCERHGGGTGGENKK